MLEQALLRLWESPRRFDDYGILDHDDFMSTDASFTVLQLQESAGRLPDLASTAEPRVEVAVDDGIFRHSEHYPHYDHHAIVPPRPVMTFQKSSSEGQWEFSGSVKLLPYEVTEAQQDGIDAWLRAKIGSRCAHLEVGALEGAVVPVRLLLHGARTTSPPEIVTGSYANDPEEAIKNPFRDRGAAPVKGTA